MGLSLRGQTSGAVDINAPAVAGDNTITLPDGNGSANQFYKNSTTAGIVTHSSMVEDANGNVTIGGTFSLGTGTSISSPSSNVLTLGTNDNERIRITSTGGVGVNTTTIPAGVNVAVGGTIRVQDSTDTAQYLTINHLGVNFQNTGAGSSTTATSHLLDDYEEGTWTPVYEPQNGSFGSITYDAVVYGYYQKVGEVVHITGFIRTDALTVGTASGNLFLAGLPYSPHIGVGENQGIYIPYTRDWAGDHPTSGLNSSSGDRFALYYKTAINANSLAIQVSDMNTGPNDNTIYFAGFFRVS